MIQKYNKIKIRCFLFSFFFWAFSFAGNAQVSLPASDLGLTSTNDGVAGPAYLYEAFFGSQNATKFKDKNGNNIPGNNKLNAQFMVNHFVTVSQKPLWGGFPAFEILVPIVHADVKIQGPGVDDSKFGLGDITVGVGIQWPNKKLFGKTFFHRFLLNGVVPAGSYSKTDAVNTGSNVWSIMPYYAFTIYWDKATKWETSMRFRYQWNSKNTDVIFANDVQPGQATWINYGVSYMAYKNFRIGFAGYWVQQLSEHKIADTKIPDSKEMAFSVGPSFFYQHKTSIFRLTGAFDVSAKNRFTQAPFINFTFSKIWPKK